MESLSYIRATKNALAPYWRHMVFTSGFFLEEDRIKLKIFRSPFRDEKLMNMIRDYENNVEIAENMVVPKIGARDILLELILHPIMFTGVLKQLVADKRSLPKFNYSTPEYSNRTQVCFISEGFCVHQGVVHPYTRSPGRKEVELTMLQAACLESFEKRLDRKLSKIMLYGQFFVEQ